MKGKVDMPTALLPTMAILRCFGWGGAISMYTRRLGERRV